MRQMNKCLQFLVHRNELEDSEVSVPWFASLHGHGGSEQRINSFFLFSFFYFFFSSCLLRCSGFSAAVQESPGMLMGGRKREWVCECMCVSVMGSEGEREGAWAIGRLRSIVALHPTDNSEHFRIIVHGTYPAKVPWRATITSCWV